MRSFPPRLTRSAAAAALLLAAGTVCAQGNIDKLKQFKVATTEIYTRSLVGSVRCV